MSENNDFETDWIYAQYENGESVTSIAAEIGRSEAYVYSKMRKKPDKYENVKQAREEARNIRVRRCSALADAIVQKYLEDMQGDPEKAQKDIDKINNPPRTPPPLKNNNQRPKNPLSQTDNLCLHMPHVCY